MAKGKIGDYSRAKLINIVDSRVGDSTIGGSDTQIQYNNGGSAFGGISVFTWDDTNLKIADDTKLIFGTNSDASIEYDENDTDELRFAGAAATFEQDVTFDNNVTLGIAATDVTTVTGRLTSSQGMLVPDNTQLIFGTNSDAHIKYRETSDDYLVISGSSNGIVLSGTTVQIRGTLEGASPLKIAGGIEIVPSSNGETPTAMSFGDDIKLYFGDDDDSFIQFNDGVGNYLELSGSHNGIVLSGSSVYVDQYLGIGVSPSNITHAITLPESDTNSGKIKATAYTTYSSARYKENVQPIQNPLQIVNNLEGVTFDWKRTQSPDIGFVAEQVGKHLPNIVDWEENGTDAQSMDYSKIVPILVEAIKNQQSQIDKLKDQIIFLNGMLKDN